MTATSTTGWSAAVSFLWAFRYGLARAIRVGRDAVVGLRSSGSGVCGAGGPATSRDAPVGEPDRTGGDRRAVAGDVAQRAAAVAEAMDTGDARRRR